MIQSLLFPPSQVPDSTPLFLFSSISNHTTNPPTHPISSTMNELSMPQYPKDDGDDCACPTTTTSVHVTALDGLVNVNSLFTVAVFVGLSLATRGQHNLDGGAACDAGLDEAKRLIVYEVVSFSFFMFSSLVAQGLKLALNLLNSKQVNEANHAPINKKVLRFGMLGSALGSVMGCLFLLLSMVNVIQIRLGLLSCHSVHAVRAVAVAATLISTALVVYISTAIYAFTH